MLTGFSLVGQWVCAVLGPWTILRPVLLQGSINRLFRDTTVNRILPVKLGWEERYPTGKEAWVSGKLVRIWTQLVHLFLGFGKVASISYCSCWKRLIFVYSLGEHFLAGKVEYPLCRKRQNVYFIKHWVSLIFVFSPLPLNFEYSSLIFIHIY